MEINVKKLEKALELFLISNRFIITVDEIKNIIYNSHENNKIGARKYNEMWLGLCEDNNIEISDNVVELFQECRNNFPHKTLGGKTPAQVYFEKYGSQ